MSFHQTTTTIWRLTIEQKKNTPTLRIHMPIPTIIVDSPGKTSRPAQMSPGPTPPLSSTPGYEQYSPSFPNIDIDADADGDWTPGPYTPDTPVPTSTSAIPGYPVGNDSKVWVEARN
jgi:hypothetical protein